MHAAAVVMLCVFTSLCCYAFYLFYVDHFHEILFSFFFDSFLSAASLNRNSQIILKSSLLEITFILVEALVALGYKREDIEASLAQTRYDDVHATYLLIGRKNIDVSPSTQVR